jgi:hypothetical protein
LLIRFTHAPRRSVRTTVARLALVGVVSLGVGLRLEQLLANRSLSLDESLLALNLIHRSPLDVLRQLDFNQSAPPLFLTVQKVDVLAFGKTETALRLFPFVCGVMALCLFPFLARRVCNGTTAVLVATGFFAVSDAAIAYSALDKQYEVDVAAVVLLCYIALHAERTLSSYLKTLGVSFAGALILWFSFPAVFVAAGIVATLIARSILIRASKETAMAALIGLSWLVSFGGIYAVSRSGVRDLQHSFSSTSGVFVGSGDSRGGALDHVGSFRYVLGIPRLLVFGPFHLGQILTACTLVFCVVGAIVLFEKKRVVAAMLISPLPFLMAASALHKYPLLPRTLLFVLPMILLLLASGIETTLQRAPGRLIEKVIMLGVVALGVAVLGLALYHAVRPRSSEEMKPILRHLAKEQRSTDTLYVFPYAQYAFRYYLECGCIDATVRQAESKGIWPFRPAPGGPEQSAPALVSARPRLIIGEYRGRAPSSYSVDLRALQNSRRAWILLSDLPRRDRDSLVDELNKFGTRITSFRGGPAESSAVVYLYEMNSKGQ